MKVKDIIFLDGFSVKLTFSDGFSAQMDFSPALGSDDPLCDPQVFRQGKPNGLTIEWPGGIDFCPDVLRLWCEAGKVLSPQETAQLLSSSVRLAA